MLPLWFTFKGGRHVEKSPSGRTWRELAWEAFRINVIWPNAENGLERKVKTLATDAATAAGLKFEPNGFACFRFFDGTRIKPGDRFVLSDVVGGTERNVQEYVDRAMGGVLFIDEAYGLNTSDFGAAGIDKLLPILENRKGASS